MFTDIAGYTEQMSKDQDVAFVLLEEKQSKFKPLIKEQKEIEFYINFVLFKLLEDTSYLETSYNEIQEKASAKNEDLGKKFLTIQSLKQL